MHRCSTSRESVALCRWPQGGTESVRGMRVHATRGCGTGGAALCSADGGHPCVPGEGAGGCPWDFDARVGSAAVNFDVIGRFGETHNNASGQRLIQLLHGTGMYALNGRVPSMQPAWTFCRMSRSEQSILDYILGDTDCFSSAPPVRVFQADVSDHYLVHHCLEP